jgi:ATP-binding cassette subfamily B protein
VKTPPFVAPQASPPSTSAGASAPPPAASAAARRARRVTLRRLVGLARPEAPALAVGTLLLLIGSGMSLLYPQGMRFVIDTAIGDGPLPAWTSRLFGTPLDRGQLLHLVALAMGLIALVQALSGAGRFYLFNVAGESVVARLRKSLYARILEQEVAFFDGERTGELTNRLSNDATVLQGAVSANVSLALRNLAQTLGGGALLLATSPRLAALMLAVVPAIAVGAVAYGRRIRKLSKEVQDRLAASAAIAEEALSGLRTVRSFAAEQVEAARYATRVDESFELSRRRSKASALFMAAVLFAGYTAAALVFWYGGRLVLRQELSPGQLTSFLVYTLMVGFALGSLADLWADFMKSIGAAERIFELLDRQPSIPASGGLQLPQVDGRLAFEGIRFAYPTRPEAVVLDALTLELAAGERVALVGPSGAGKSTLAQLVARFYDPSAGEVRLDGVPLTSLDPAWLRRQVGVVAQEPVLFSTTIEDNIRYGAPGASAEAVVEAARIANAESFIQRFPDGYRTLVGERGVQLSGGQKQRVAIARAVLKDPRILILDEATSALDAESEQLVKEALDRLMVGRTTLIIAHRLSTVIDADRVVVIDGGKVVQAGSHAALLAEGGLYRRLVERQFARDVVLPPGLSAAAASPHASGAAS